MPLPPVAPLSGVESEREGELANLLCASVLGPVGLVMCLAAKGRQVFTPRIVYSRAMSFLQWLAPVLGQVVGAFGVFRERKRRKCGVLCRLRREFYSFCDGRPQPRHSHCPFATFAAPPEPCTALPAIRLQQ